MSDLPPPVPAYPPSAYPPIYRDQRKTDADHLRLLSIFSYVSAGLALLGLVFIVFHYSMMQVMMNTPEMFQGPHGSRDPNPALLFRKMFGMMIWFCLAWGLWGVLLAVLNVLAGYFLGLRRNRTFCLVVAGMNCIRIPLGTTLGVFTFVVLMRDSVRQLYEATEAGAAAAPNKLAP